MRKVIVAAACLVLTTTFASAQSSGRDYDRGMTEEERAADEEDERGSYEGERGRRSGMRGGGRRHSGRSGGARFIVRSGDTRLSVQCDKRETMQSCVDAALLLFEKMGSKQQIPRINDTPTTPR